MCRLPRREAIAALYGYNDSSACIPFDSWSDLMASGNPAVQTRSAQLPAVPLTLEGLSVLHQMFRFRWPEWRKLSPARQQEIACEAASALAAPEAVGQSAV